MVEMMEQINGQMQSLPPIVQYWMNWMGAVFMASILFIWKKKAARYVLLAIFLPMLIGIAIFHFTQNVHLFGIGHLLVWTPLFYYLVTHEIKQEGFSFKSIYGVWLLLLMATIVISLVFDVRDLFLVMTGQK